MVLPLKNLNNRRVSGSRKRILKVASLKRILRVASLSLRIDSLGAARKTKFFYSSFLLKKNEILLLHRPLLSVSRNNVKKVCHLWQLPIHPDASNQNLQYVRNRIRKQLLPTLRFYFNRHLDGTLLQFTKLTSTEQLYMEYLSQRVFPFLCVVARRYIAFQISGLKPFPLAIRRQILKRGLERYATRSLHLSHIDDLFRFIEKKRLQNHRFLGESRLCLLPIRSEKRIPFRDEKEKRGNQQIKDVILVKNETVSSSLYHVSSLRKGKLPKKQKVLTQYVDALKRGRKACLVPSVSVSFSRLASSSASLKSKVSLRVSFAEQLHEPSLNIRAEERKGLTSTSPIPSAIWIREARMTPTSLQKALIPPSREASLQLPQFLKMAGSIGMVKGLNSCLGIPTHRFLPTGGSLLFLGKDSPLLGEDRISIQWVTLNEDC